MLFSTAVFVLGLAQLTASANLLKRWDNLAEKHAWVDIPKGWSYKATAPVDYVFNLKIALKQHRFNELIDNLMEISDPTHIRSIESFVFLEGLKPNFNSQICRTSHQGRGQRIYCPSPRFSADR